MAAVAPDRRKRSQREIGLEQLLAARHARERRLRRRRRSVVSILALLVAAIVVLVLAAAAFTGPTILASFCSLNDLRPLSLGSNSFLYADNGSLLGVVPSATNRQPLPLSKMSPWLPEATVAIEDARFWQHGALDYQGIVARALRRPDERPDRAGRLDAHAAARPQPLHRRSAEDVLAQDQGGVPRRQALPRMQTQYGADARKQILAAYLNEVFYGAHAYGVEAAAETYFSQERVGAHAQPGGAHRRAAAGADDVRPARQPAGSRSRGATRCCGRC